MDLSKLSMGDKVIGASGILLFIFGFFPWFKYDAGFFNVSQNGWHFFFTGIVPILLGLILIAYIAATKLTNGVNLPDLPVGYPLVVLGVAGLAALLVILRLLLGGDDGGSDVLDRSFGMYLATLAGIGLAAGGFLKFQEEGGELPTKSTGTGSQGGQAGGDGGAPTPF